MGVLLRIALAYGIASLLLYFFKLRVVVIIGVVILLLYWPMPVLSGVIVLRDPLSSDGQCVVLKLDKWLLGDNLICIVERAFPSTPKACSAPCPPLRIPQIGG